MSAKITYPRLLRRVQAVLIDSLIMAACLYLFLYLVVAFEVDNTIIKAMAIIFPLLMLEPLLVSISGGTIGHHFLKIRVRSISCDKNINILLAIVRFIVKTTLGWASLIVVLLTRKHQAIHDLVSRSVMINKDSSSLPKYEALEEREYENSNYTYPSKTRRIIIILLYTITTMVFFNFIYILFISDGCLRGGTCSIIEQSLGFFINCISFFTIATVIVLGWRGELYGCKKS